MNRVRKAQSLGAGEFIQKPFTFSNLGIIVKKELEGK